jgi:hypothetical protein
LERSGLSLKEKEDNGGSDRKVIKYITIHTELGILNDVNTFHVFAVYL